METTAPKPETKKKKSTPQEAFRRIDGPALKTLIALRDKANKKDFGRRVRDSDIIGLALSLVTEAHLTELQEKTLTNKDRLALKHSEYMKTHGKIGFDEFLGKLMQGAI